MYQFFKNLLYNFPLFTRRLLATNELVEVGHLFPETWILMRLYDKKLLNAVVNRFETSEKLI